MASVRGLLNIQSLNESTHENNCSPQNRRGRRLRSLNHPAVSRAGRGVSLQRRLRFNTQGRRDPGQSYITIPQLLSMFAFMI